jgi:pimeloyl-ACP methyl ester carboxylesterase
MAGARDDKFNVEARAIASSLTCGSYLSIPDAHHAAHLERPAQTAGDVLEFISKD